MMRECIALLKQAHYEATKEREQDDNEYVRSVLEYIDKAIADAKMYTYKRGY